MHQFTVCGECIGTPDLSPLGRACERKYRLDQIVQATSRFTYEYDFGDGWTHDVVIERAADLADLLPDHICIEGRRACPPEDCGDPHGYAALVIALSNTKHPEHKERLEWLGLHSEPEAFDIDAVNKQLRTLAAK